MIVLRRFAASISSANPRLVSRFCSYGSKSWSSSNRNEGTSGRSTSASKSGVSFRVRSLPSFWQDQRQLDISQMEVVNSDVWSVSSCLSHVSKGEQEASRLRLLGLEEVGDGVAHNPKQIESDNDIDDVEEMRLRGTLYYKIEHKSLELDEYKFDFHGTKRKRSKNYGMLENKKYNPRFGMALNDQTSYKSKEHGLLVNKERLAKIIKDEYTLCAPDEDSCTGKKQRKPTFNQLTGPYHEPFCLDIFVSRCSVRACVVHRVTSKVVIVAHSISKDMKHDVGSTNTLNAATAVGKLAAQRALEDDIHDVIYTPRKGDKLEGKLQVVLQSIMDNGLNVKLKLKQRNPIKATRTPLTSG